MPQIYIAAAIITVLALAAAGGGLVRLCPPTRRKWLVLLIALEIPLHALAFECVRLPVHELLKGAFPLESGWFAFLQNFYAPLTEEPAKLLPLLILPALFAGAGKRELVLIAVAVGLGFGIGETWLIATKIQANPAVSGYQWHEYGGFMLERSMVMLIHAGFTCAALHLGVLKRRKLAGLAVAMGLHFLANYPIYLLGPHGIAASFTVFQIVLTLWVIGVAVGAARYLLWLGVDHGDARGSNGAPCEKSIWKARCPRCETVFVRRMLRGINLGTLRYEPCPSCKKWSLTRPWQGESEAISNPGSEPA